MAILAVHGGAGGEPSKKPPRWHQPERLGSLKELLEEIGPRLDAGEISAVDAVELAVRWMEDDEFFNAGKGAVLDANGEFALDASIMDGRTLSGGAVLACKRTKNPISLARAVMEKIDPVILVGEGADTFAEELGYETVDEEYFRTDIRVIQWSRWFEKSMEGKSGAFLDHDCVTDEEESPSQPLPDDLQPSLDESGEEVQEVEVGLIDEMAESEEVPGLEELREEIKEGDSPQKMALDTAQNKEEEVEVGESCPTPSKKIPTDEFGEHGTVGAVALDNDGNLAAATSTGGLTGRVPGRIGDSGIIGAGTWAENGVVAVSCTGIGEAFIQRVAAARLGSLMNCAGMSLKEAGRHLMVEELLPLGGRGGLITISADGEVEFPMTAAVMYRGYWKPDVGTKVASLLNE